MPPAAGPLVGEIAVQAGLDAASWKPARIPIDLAPAAALQAAP